jgi:hypothetical protein
MQEPHVEGVATHDDPESCSDSREAAAEALTGARTGTVSSREINPSGVPTLLTEAEGNTNCAASARRNRLRAVGGPWHVQSLSAREPGGPHVARG